MRKPKPPEPRLLTCEAIALLIAKQRGHCTRATVWRVINKLKIAAVPTASRNKFYDPSVVDVVAAELRTANYYNLKTSTARA
jgi:arginine repressor